MHCEPGTIAITEQADILHHNWVHCAPIDEVVDRAAVAIVQNLNMDAAAGRHRTPAAIFEKFIQKYRISSIDAAILRAQVLAPGFLDQYHRAEIPWRGGTIPVVIGPHQQGAQQAAIGKPGSPYKKPSPTTTTSPSGASSTANDAASQLSAFFQKLTAELENIAHPKSTPPVIVLPSGPTTVPTTVAPPAINWDSVVKGVLIGAGIVVLLKSLK